jgi:hypothetical protein
MASNKVTVDLRLSNWDVAIMAAINRINIRVKSAILNFLLISFFSSKLANDPLMQYNPKAESKSLDVKKYSPS